MATIGLHEIEHSIAAPIIELLWPVSPYSIWFILCSAVLASVAYWLTHKDGKPGFRKILRYLFPKEVILHPSAVLDYQYFFVSRIVQAFIVGLVSFPTALWGSRAVVAGMDLLFGHSAISLPPVLSVVLKTIGYVFAFDLGYWCLHWLMHKLPWLWEVHKAHHSAEVLTPLTAMRSHPLEEILEGIFVGTVTGGVSGIFAYVNGHEVSDFHLFGVNILMMIYFVTIFNLRHSHIWMPIRGPLACIIQSPAHHQLHHSAETKHFDKNFGFCLSFWDWVFGTLYTPPAERDFKLGIGAESSEYHKLMPFLLLPFIKIARRIKRGRNPAVHGQSAE